MAWSASCENTLPIAATVDEKAIVVADDEQGEQAIAAALQEALDMLGIGAAAHETAELHRLAGTARELRKEASALRAQAAQAEAAEGFAGEAAEALREERAVLMKACDQIFGLVIGFSGFQRPKAGSAKSPISTQSSALLVPTPSHDPTPGDGAKHLLLDQVSSATQARDQAKRILESASKAQKEAEDYVEWVRGDVEVLQQDCESRSSRLSLRVDGAPHVLPARQDGPSTARCLDLEAGLASPPAYEWAVRIGDENVVRCTRSGAHARDSRDPVGLYTGGSPCELNAVAPGRTAVTVHRRRKGRGVAAWGVAPWPLPVEDAYMVTVSEAGLTLDRYAERQRTLLLDRTQSMPCDTNTAASGFDGSCSFHLQSGSFSFGDACASSSFLDGSGTPLWVEVTPREPPLSPDAAQWRASSSMTPVGNPMGSTSPRISVMQPLTPAGDPPGDLEKISSDMTASTAAPPPPPLRSPIKEDADDEARAVPAPSVQRTGSSRGSSGGVSFVSDAEGFAQVAAQFRCADANGRGFIRRTDLAKLLKALDAGEWSDARIDRLMGAIDACRSSTGGTSHNVGGLAGGRPIQYEEFLEWLFGTPASVEPPAVSAK